MGKYKTDKNRTISNEEFEKLLHAANTQRNKTLIALLYLTGARMGEVATLRKTNFAFDYPVPGVWLVRVRTLKRRADVGRDLRFPDSAPGALEIKQFVSQLGQWDDFLFPGRSTWVFGKNRDYQKSFPSLLGGRRIEAIVSRTCVKAGLPELSPHLFRHNRGKWFAARNASPWQIQSWMGHASISSTNVYTAGGNYDMNQEVTADI